MKRTLLGYIEIDSGTLLIGDPAYVLPDAEQHKLGVDYAAVIRAPPDVHAIPLAGTPTLLLQRFGGDGRFPVYGEIVDGELVRAAIEFEEPED